MDNSFLSTHVDAPSRFILHHVSRQYARRAPRRCERGIDTPASASSRQHQSRSAHRGLGACGITNKDSDHIVAVSHSVFDVYPGYTGANPNDNPICDQGKSVIVTVTDRCVSCDMTDLDFSPSVFRELADPSVGRIGVTWSWV
ncbi:RlpA-like double-psi beta-barrel-protein domain-containing protein-containing protein [Lactifluus volemus]|nr:RlpA-like double-psi beta-barrel-protein domain-containing protein-containing protein [Lactifluus volemus]